MKFVVLLPEVMGIVGSHQSQTEFFRSLNQIGIYQFLLFQPMVH